MSKVLIFTFLLGMLFNSYYCWVINDINTKLLAKSVLFNDISDDEVDSATFQQKINFIFPGTKWCGAGNVADSYDDLGVEKEADMCCREHDHCPDLIPGGETKYNLTNTAFYTRLNCSCDERFLECLRDANTKVARFIGIIYFDALQTKCFREDYPVTECVKKGGWFKTKCVEHAYDTSGDKIYQWFDVPDYSRI